MLTNTKASMAKRREVAEAACPKTEEVLDEVLADVKRLNDSVSRLSIALLKSGYDKARIHLLNQKANEVLYEVELFKEPMRAKLIEDSRVRPVK